MKDNFGNDRSTFLSFLFQRGFYEGVDNNDLEKGTKKRKIKYRYSNGQKFATQIITITTIMLVVSIIMPGAWLKYQATVSPKKSKGKAMSGRGQLVNHTFPVDTFFPKNVENRLRNILIGVPIFNLDDGDIPLFWNIPSSGSVIQSILTGCFHFILAAQKGAIDVHEETLKITSVDGHQYVNVDLSVASGIERASDLNLASSGLADVFVTNHLHFASAKLFNESHHGVMFAMIRHPIEQSIATYMKYAIEIKEATGEELTVEQYFESRPHEQNWLVKYLNNNRFEEVTEEHLITAREILLRKCIIGLYDRIEESMTRFQKVFGWVVPPDQENSLQVCTQGMIQSADARESMMSNIFKDTTEGSEIWNFFDEKTKFDQELYLFALQLYNEQKLIFE